MSFLRSTDRRRARTEDEKDARRASLVSAGRSMLAARGLDDIKIAEVASEAGVAKGTAYLYFSSKEALFLSVFAAEITAWFDQLDAMLTAGGGRDDLAREIARSLACNPVLLDLMTQLHVRLEANASDEEIRAFKQLLRSRLNDLAAKLEAWLEWPAGSGEGFFLSANALIIGLAQICRPPGRVRAIIEADPDLPPVADFETACAEGLRALLAE
ncbi:MAG: TetR family transcriptional regulator [Pseudomonadota bacterium]